MAKLMFTYGVQVAPAAGPVTVFQVVTTPRVVLHAIEITPQGASGPTAPMRWELALQSDSGASTDDSLAITKTSPVGAEAVTTLIRAAFTAEPTTNTPMWEFGMHQQSTRLWLPPGGPIILEGGKMYGLRYRASFQVDAYYRVHLEE